MRSAHVKVVIERVGLASVCALLSLGALHAVDLHAQEPLKPFAPSQNDYVLACAGCHGLDGASHSRVVPRLKGRAGYYLADAEGRAYLSRLPNVAFSTLSDAQLAAVLNYIVFDLGEGSAPAGVKPYAGAEVAKWRKQPLTEVALSQYRQRVVETLIGEHHAPAELRNYGDGLYGNN